LLILEVYKSSSFCILEHSKCMQMPAKTADEAKNSGSPALELGRVARITLRRPAQANRIEAGDVAVIVNHCEAISSDRHVRAVVLSAVGTIFSAGYDLTSVRDDRQLPEQPFDSAVNAIERLPQVTVCALNGAVYGGSIDLALACDFRYGVPSTTMCMPTARIGLQYYLSGTRRYFSRLGLDAAKRLLLLAEKLDAEEMLALGVLHEIVEAGALEERAMETATRAADLAPLALAGMKRVLNALADGTFDPDAAAQAELVTKQSADFREGLAAWHEKRPPKFEGQ
jgi:enoyl-CoA hydratase